MSDVNYQNGPGESPRPQTQSGPDGAADVFLVDSGTPIAVAGLDPSGSVRALAINADGALTGSYAPFVTVPRPANTTAYTGGDVVGGLFEIRFFGPAGGMVGVQAAQMFPQIASVPTGMTSFRAHFYSKPPASIADNAVWTLPIADLPAYQSYVDIGSPAVAGVSGNAVLQANSGTLSGVPVKLAPGVTSVWCYVVTNGGFTPAANSELYSYLVQTISL